MSSFAELPSHAINYPIAHYPSWPQRPIVPTAEYAAQLARAIAQIQQTLDPEERKRKLLELKVIQSTLALKGQETEAQKLENDARRTKNQIDQGNAQTGKSIMDRSNEYNGSGPTPDPKKDWTGYDLHEVPSATNNGTPLGDPSPAAKRGDPIVPASLKLNENRDDTQNGTQDPRFNLNQINPAVAPQQFQRINVAPLSPLLNGFPTTHTWDYRNYAGKDQSALPSSDQVDTPNETTESPTELPTEAPTDLTPLPSGTEEA